jgi:hypothetical protein
VARRMDYGHQDVKTTICDISYNWLPDMLFLQHE